MKKTLILAVAGVVMSTAGCFPKAGPVPPPASANAVAAAAAKWPGVTSETLAAGRVTFVAKCNNCHAYPDVQAIEDAKWPSIVEEMGHKAKLYPPQTEGVLRFILASRASGAP